jgi:DNA-binding CsgD family transcriptional regulator
MIDKVQLTPKQIEAMELQRQGFTYQQIADKLGITREAVSYRLTNARRRIAGLIVNKAKPNKTQLTQKEAEVLALRNQGLKYQQIADELGISHKKVKSRLWKARNFIKTKERSSGQ